VAEITEKLNNHDIDLNHKNIFAKLARYKKTAKVQHTVENIIEEKQKQNEIIKYLTQYEKNENELDKILFEPIAKNEG